MTAEPRPASVDQALEAGGTTWSQLVGWGCFGGAEETTLLVGPCIDGLAPAGARVELLVVSPQAEPHEGVVIREPTLLAQPSAPSEGIEIDVELWSPTQLAVVARRFASALAGITAPRSGFLQVLEDGEISVLHRVRTGVAVANSAVASGWRDRLQVAALPVYVGRTAAVRCSGHLALAQAEMAAGSWDSAAWLSRLAHEELAVALLATSGETCPDRVWHLRLLERHRDRLGPAVVDELVDGILAERRCRPAAVVRQVGWAARTVTRLTGPARVVPA